MAEADIYPCTINFLADLCKKVCDHTKKGILQEKQIDIAKLPE